MELKDLMALVNAGFTKSEIMQLTGSKTEKTPEVKPEAKPESKKEEPKKEEKAAEPIKTEDVKQADAVKEAFDKALDERFKTITDNMENLYNKMATMAGMPSLAEVQPKGIEDIVSRFFKEE